MKNEIYCRTLVPEREAPDGETPTQVVVTCEVNCYLVWHLSFEKGTRILSHFYGQFAREDALEWAMRRELGFCPECGGDPEICEEDL